MKRFTCALFALSLGFTVACAEQPGKKKEEDTKAEAKSIDGKKADAKPADAKPAPKAEKAEKAEKPERPEKPARKPAAKKPS